MSFATRLKKLTSYIYSPTDPASEDAIREQIDDSIQEVYDNTTEVLVSTTLGNSGSNTVGHNSTSVTADNVGDALEENRQEINRLLPVPDDSITDDKLAPNIKVLEKIQASAFTAEANGVSIIPHNLPYDASTDVLVASYENLYLENPLNYVDSVDDLDVELIDWTIDVSETIEFTLYKNTKRKVYGIRVNQATGEIERISEGANMELSDFDSVLPWSGIRRCNLADNLTVNDYFGDAGYIEDGSNGQCMVEIPLFFYKRRFIDSDTIEIYISSVKNDGFKVHPWFYDVDGNLVSKKYVSSYEGSVYDVSAAAYLLADEQVADFTQTTGDKVASIANAKPASGVTQDLTIVKARILANNRGAGWEQLYHTAISAIQMLFVVEFGSLDCQESLGQGIVLKPTGTGNDAENTGQTSLLGNDSGNGAGSEGLTSVSYRGIENLWGNMTCWLDGINLTNYEAYISDVNGNFDSVLFSGRYVNAGQLPLINGYMMKPINPAEFDYSFIAGEVILNPNPGGHNPTNDGTYADLYGPSPDANNKAFNYGGHWETKSDAGIFYASAGVASNINWRHYGVRLCT